MPTFDSAMRAVIAKSFVAAAALVAVTAIGHPLRRLPTETRVVAPLADPSLVPGVGRCTSDRVCAVTDERGTRPGTPFDLRP